MRTIVAVVVALLVFFVARKAFANPRARVSTEGPRISAKPGVTVEDACPGTDQAWNGNTGRCEQIPEEFLR